MVIKQGKKKLDMDIDSWEWCMSEEVYEKCKLKNKIIDNMEFESGDCFEFDELTINMKKVKIVVQ